MFGKLYRAYEIFQSDGWRQLLNSASMSLRWRAKMSRKRLRKLPQYWYRARYRDGIAGPYTLIHIDPSDVEYLISPQFQEDLPPNDTYIVGGNWDQTIADSELHFYHEMEDVTDERKLVPLDRYVFYRSVKNHIQQGTPWHETEFYQWITALDDVPGQILYGDSETREWRFDQLDRLAEAMRTDGYKSQRECSDETAIIAGEERIGSTIHRNVSSRDIPPEFHEVVINIGRDGTLIFEEGRHRFVVARALGIDSIPVRVFVRHKKWQQKREEVALASTISDLSAETAKQLSHPDLAGLSDFGSVAQSE